jgi:hypothetical protein
MPLFDPELRERGGQEGRPQQEDPLDRHWRAAGQF